jgi:ATP-dependent Zn protease
METKRRHVGRWVVVVILIGCLGIGYYLFWHRARPEKTVSFSQLIAEVRRDGIATLTVSGEEVTAEQKSSKHVLRTTAPPTYLDLIRLAEEHNVEVTYRSGSSAWTWMLQGLGPTLQIATVFLLVSLLIAMRRGFGSGAKEFISTEKFQQAGQKTEPTFDDIGGSQAAKDALQTIANYLRDPVAYQKLGARAPKGVLLVGPPGTGKTLLARAVASEVGRPFFSASGSAFVELFVGVGASRIRDLFDRARKNAPCVVFIDELDAFARRRSASDTATNHEQDQALNELLIQLDGFSDRVGVVVIAATNRPDVLDPAVVRTGRFDQQITVPLPDNATRARILDIHLQPKRNLGVLAPEVLSASLACQTAGFSGADLEGLVNRAALKAASKKRELITVEEFSECLDEFHPASARVDGLRAEIDNFITGQKGAKAAVLAGVRLHYSPTAALHSNGASGQKKPCVALLGERGTQKTTLIRKVASYLGVVFHECSAADLITGDSYGRDPIHMLLRNVIAAADGNIKRAERAIVCITGIERLLRRGGYENGQRSLARLIRGGRTEVQLVSPLPNPDIRQLDSSQMLIFLVGHSPEVENMINKRYAAKDFVTMKKLFNDEQAELISLGWSDDLMEAISVVAVCSPLTVADYTHMLKNGDGSQYLAGYQSVLDARGVGIVLSDHVMKIANKIQGRGEGAAGVAGTLSDLCLHLLSCSPDRVQTALDEYLGTPEESTAYEEHYRNVDPFTILSEVPPEVASVITQSQVQGRQSVVLVEQPFGVSSADTTLDKVLPWLRDRMIACANLMLPGVESANPELVRVQGAFSSNVEQASKTLDHIASQLLGGSQAAEAVDRLMMALDKGAIDSLRALVLLHGIAARLDCVPARRLIPATALLLQAARSMAMLDVVRLAYELRGGVRDELGLGGVVAGLATALNDGLAEIDGEGLLADESRKEDRGIEPERLVEALAVMPDFKRAVCDIVARLRESLDLSARDLDGISARAEWATCKSKLQRRGDTRNTPNLILLLGAVDSCVRAVGVVSNKEVLLMSELVIGQILGRVDRTQERIQYWRRQIQAFQKLLKGEKRRETFLLWKDFDCDPNRIESEIRAVAGAAATNGHIIPNKPEWERVMDMLDQHYTALKSEAVAIFEKHISTQSLDEEKTVGLVVDEFDSEAIMDHCIRDKVSYITVIPAVK